MTIRARTLAGELLRRAGDHGDEEVLRFTEAGETGGGTRWTYQDLWESARRVASGLRDAGFRTGDRLLVLAPDVRAAVQAHFGAWVLGAVPIHLGLPYRVGDLAAFVGELRTTAERLRARALLASRMVLGRTPADEGIRVLSIDALAATRPATLADPDMLPAPDLLQLTSGSTGHPRAVVIPHERLVLHLDAIVRGLPAGVEASGVTWLPLYHDMGLIGGLLYPYYARFPVHVLSPLVFQSQPFQWLAAMHAARATHTAAPPSAYAILLRLARRAAEEGVRLDRLRCAMIGAEPISASLLRRFADAFGPCGFSPNAFFPVYGLAEATVAVTFPEPLAPPRIARVDRAQLERDGLAAPAVAHGDESAKNDENEESEIELVGVGTPLHGTEVKVTGEDGRAVPEGRVGEIRVRSQTLMAGYDAEPAATAAAVVDGWLRTGDLGFQEGGALFVTGRCKEIIIKGGHNFYPEPIEADVSEVDGVRPGCVAAVGIRSERQETERLVVFAETKLGAEAFADLALRVRERLRRSGVAIDDVVLLPPGSLPRTTSGKLRRGEVAARLATAKRV
jgi:acyl-CoA synthetase (AMP-forming)/AMP-acid ligase II